MISSAHRVMILKIHNHLNIDIDGKILKFEKMVSEQQGKNSITRSQPGLY